MRFTLLCLSALLCSSGCVSVGGGGVSQRGPSQEYKQLRKIEKSIKKRLSNLTKPVRKSKSVLRDLKLLAKTDGVSGEQYRTFLESVLNGQAVVFPATLPPETKKRFERFSRSLAKYRDGIARGIDASELLSEEMADDLVRAGELIAKIEGRYKLHSRDPLAPQQTKMKALNERNKARRLKKKIERKLAKAKTELKSAPTQFASAAVDFQNELRGVGIERFNALETLEQQLAREAKAKGGALAKDAQSEVEDQVESASGGFFDDARNSLNQAQKEIESSAGLMQESVQAARDNVAEKSADAQKTIETDLNRAAGEVVSTAKPAVKSVEDNLNSAANEITETTRQGADKAAEVSRSAESSVNKSASKAGKDVKKGVRAAEKSINKAAQSVSKSASKTVDEATKNLNDAVNEANEDD